MNFYVTCLLIFVTFSFVLGTTSDLFNLTRLNDPLPKEFEGVFDPPKYAKALAYQKTKTYFGLIQGSISYIITILFIYFQGFGLLDQWIIAQEIKPSFNGVAYIGVLLAARLLLSLPFSIYDTFITEQRYGFNKTTAGLFISDLLKGILLSALIGIPVYMGVAYFLETSGTYGWLIAWIGFTLFQIILMYLAPAVIMPLFNKFTPLADGEVKEAIQAYAKTRNFKLSGIFTMDSSKRSTKSNAFFTGFGKFRRLVLFDSLLEKHSVKELVAIFAHEVGHFERKHILKNLVLALIPTAVLFYCVAWVLGNQELFNSFSMTGPSIYGGLIFVSLFFGPASEVLSIFTQFLSRKYEYEADSFSVETYGHPDLLISALKKLSADNLSHLTPHPLKVLLEYIHPPILDRIAQIKKMG